MAFLLCLWKKILLETGIVSIVVTSMCCVSEAVSDTSDNDSWNTHASIKAAPQPSIACTSEIKWCETNQIESENQCKTPNRCQTRIAIFILAAPHISLTDTILCWVWGVRQHLWCNGRKGYLAGDLVNVTNTLWKWHHTPRKWRHKNSKMLFSPEPLRIFLRFLHHIAPKTVLFQSPLNTQYRKFWPKVPFLHGASLIDRSL